jgi:hypothetical protein
MSNIQFNHQKSSSKLKFILNYIANTKKWSPNLIDELYWSIRTYESSKNHDRKYGDHKHKQIKVYNPIYEDEIDVDEKLAPLLKKLWSNQIDTCLSCQDNVPKGYVWLCFETTTDFEIFINMIYSWLEKNKEYEMIERISSGNLRDNDHWDFKFCIDKNSDSDCEEIPLDINVSVRFPFKDLEILEKVFEDKKENKKIIPDLNEISF